MNIRMRSVSHTARARGALRSCGAALQRFMASGKVSLTRDAVTPGQNALITAVLGTPTAQVSG